MDNEYINRLEKENEQIREKFSILEAEHLKTLQIVYNNVLFSSDFRSMLVTNYSSNANVNTINYNGFKYSVRGINDVEMTIKFSDIEVANKLNKLIENAHAGTGKDSIDDLVIDDIIKMRNPNG